MDMLSSLPKPQGTTFLCPFDSFLWQRKRAEDILRFEYRTEIYVPAAKRKYGYYVLPILHNGRLVGRIDPKLHRDKKLLEIKAIHLEPAFDGGQEFTKALQNTFESLASNGRLMTKPTAPFGPYRINRTTVS